MSQIDKTLGAVKEIDCAETLGATQARHSDFTTVTQQEMPIA